ncbi:hypothetical protein [Rhodopirellula sp. SWK7]|uniref:hypothetical protein n=1 Tax=Rhodopirellula sp. SWK7 TaxID=595460 RepID=UPI0002BEF0B6|nr:hypothetical protein [Rhodopirellula sp. SWK7]EMI43204.1 hypothetical protein RRSWK_04169 [Rhodopirellula sp. SWK7]
MWPLTNGLRCLTGPEAALFRGGVGMMVDQLVGELNAEPDDDAASFDEELIADFGFHPPRWYSMWEPDQKVWLLERVTTSLLAARSAPPHSAIFEATVEAVYIEIADLIAMEITTGTPIQRGSWRGSLLDAYVQRCPEDSLLGALQFEATTIDPCLPPSVTKQWNAAQTHSDESTENESTENESVDASQKANPARSNEASRSEEPDWMAWWTSVIERLVDATYGPRLYHGAERLRDGDPELLIRYLRSKGVNDKFMHRIPPLRSRGQTQAAIERIQAIVFQGE